MEKKFELSENDQVKITYLITTFAKSEPNLLKYSEAIALLLDRCMFNTKLTLTHFHDLFQAAVKVKSKPGDKTQVQGERALNKQQLIFLFNQAAKILFKPDPNYLQRFYATFLSERTQSENGQINRARVMVIDDLSRKLIVEEVIKKLWDYSEEIKHLFIAYTIQNYWSLKKKHRLLLSFREMILQNKRWSYISLILFLKESETAPHIITVQHAQEVLRMVIPNINSKQQEFYSRHTLSEGYHKDVDGNEGVPHPGDPGIMLFELQLLFIRLAYDSYPKQLQKKDLAGVIQRFMKYLYLRKNQQLGKVEYPSINRKMINKMKQYYKVINNELEKETQNNQPIQQSITPFERLAKKMDKELVNAPSLAIDFQQFYKNIDKELPKLPPPPVIEPECPGPYNKKNAITIGQQPPPQPVDKNEKGKGEQKKDGGKKGEEEPLRVFKWAQVPQTKQTTEDYMKEIQDKLNFEVQPLGDINRGTIKKEGYPVLIGEILFPPELPKSVVPFIEAASNALSDRNFILAIDNLNNGAQIWKKTAVEFDSSAELFFEYSKGNVYLHAGKIQYAVQSFSACRKFDTSRLPFNNPDRSLAYYGLGEVFYEMEEFQLAARSFLKAREIREAVLGLEHVQTASTFNNLACCFFMLGRSQEALGYIQIAEVVIDAQLGGLHERTMTARSNLKKISRGTFQNKPAYRKFWEVFEEDKFEKKKKKKKDDAAKGGKKK